VSDTPRTDADDRPYPSPDYTQHINFEGCDSVVMPPEEYEALYEHARQLERELSQQKRHTEAVMRTLKDALGIEGGRDCLDQIGILVEAISLVVPKCDHLHHPKKYQHKITEPCPVEELIRKAQKP
jgi:hypothetical protein